MTPSRLNPAAGWNRPTRNEDEKGGGPGRPASLLSPLGESGKSDGGRPAGRVLACLYNPGILKKVPEKPKKVARITVEIQRLPFGAKAHATPITSQPG
jgi:hypothetical protein